MRSSSVPSAYCSPLESSLRSMRSEKLLSSDSMRGGSAGLPLALSCSVSAPIFWSSAAMKSGLAAPAPAATRSIFADRPRTSSARAPSCSLEATCETMPRNAVIAASSCCTKDGSWLTPPICSILNDRLRIASSKPARLSAGFNSRNAWYTSASPRSMLPMTAGSTPYWRLSSSRPAILRISFSSASIACFGIASLSLPEISDSSLRSAAISSFSFG